MTSFLVAGFIGACYLLVHRQLRGTAIKRDKLPVPITVPFAAKRDIDCQIYLCWNPCKC